MSARRPPRTIALFAPLGPTYDRVGARPLVRPGSALAAVPRLTPPGATAARCSTSRPAPGSSPSGCSRRGLASRASTRARRCSPCARSGSDGRVELVEASRRPRSRSRTPRSTTSRSPTSCATSTIPRATLAELARVVRPGGTIATLEFGVPRGIWRPLWDLYVGVGLPLAGRLISPGWHDVGRFLGPSIRELLRAYPLERQLELWREAGIADVACPPHEPRRRRRDLGRGRAVSGAAETRVLRAAARAAGATTSRCSTCPTPRGISPTSSSAAALRPTVSWGRLGLTVLAFFLAMGVGAHALDELDGRPLATRDPRARPRRARHRLGRRRLRDRHRRRRRLQPLDPAADRGRRLSRPGVQPRALRRPLPLRPLVRARLGRVPRRHRLRRLRRTVRPKPCSPPPGRRSSRSRSAASRPRCGARRARSAGHGRARARRRRQRAGDADAARRGSGGGAAAPRGLDGPVRLRSSRFRL